MEHLFSCSSTFLKNSFLHFKNIRKRTGKEWVNLTPHGHFTPIYPNPNHIPEISSTGCRTAEKLLWVDGTNSPQKRSLDCISADDGAPGDSVGGSSLGKSRRHVGAVGAAENQFTFSFDYFFHLLTQFTQKDKEKKCPVCGAGVGSHMWTSSRLPQ